MKIIDLLNKIANDEEVPKKIKYNNIDYFWCNQCKIYERLEDDSKDLYNDLDDLNDEVEILEEEKKTSTLNDIRESYGLPRIEEKKIPEKLDFKFEDKFIIEHFKSGAISYLSTFEAIKKLYDKQCEIIDYLKNKGE